MPVYYLSQETEGQRSRKIPALIGGLITVLILAVAAAIIAYYVTRPDDAVLTSSNAAGATQPTIVESPDIGAAFSNTVEADTNTIYVVDTSDSMKFDLDKVQDSLVSLTDEEDFSRNRVRLMTFDTGVGTAFDFDLMESPGSREDFREAVNSLETAAYSRYSNSTLIIWGSDGRTTNWSSWTTTTGLTGLSYSPTAPQMTTICITTACWKKSETRQSQTCESTLSVTGSIPPSRTSQTKYWKSYP